MTYTWCVEGTYQVIAFYYVLGHPILGAGLDTGLLAMNQVRGNLWAQVHNTYLNYALDLGLPGLALFVALQATSFRSARRVECMATEAAGAELKAFAAGVRVSLGGFALAAFFHPVPYHFYFYYIAGLSVAVKTTAERQFGPPATA